MKVYKKIRMTALVAMAIVLPLALGGCDDNIPAGKVIVKFGPEASQAVHGCDGKQWSLTVLDKDNKEHTGCVSEKTAAKYNEGDAYP